jgi:hypothetical protein
MQLLKIATALPVLLLFSCTKELSHQSTSGKAEIIISNVVDGQSLQFGVAYTNNFGEDYTVSKLKYYISNISLIDSFGNSHYVNDSYFLVDQSDPSSFKLNFQSDIGRYKAVQFLIGVDSIRNVSGAQTGALDPAKEMFWTWNSGYIMAKLEGTSSLSNLPDNRIEYHIGGFHGENKVLRTVALPFDQIYPISIDKMLTIEINSEVQSWFSSVHPISIINYPACTSPGELASQFADNYSKMFAVSLVVLQ